MALTVLNPETSARRVMWFHRLFFRQNPVVILNATERTSGKPFAEITGAARTLADQGFRVGIDGSPNATDPSAFTTKREEVVNVEPMSAKELMQDDEFQLIVANLKKAGEIHELVWGIVGGVPADYKQLAQKLGLSPPEKHLDVIGSFVHNKLDQAQIIRGDFLLAYPEAAPIVEKFKTQEVVHVERPATVPAINKVFRRIAADRYVPANPTMGFVLKYIPPGADTPNITTLIGIARGKFPYS
jgi:methylmalonyl-CoA mutase cobalamin-binding subunit